MKITKNNLTVFILFGIFCMMPFNWFDEGAKAWKGYTFLSDGIFCFSAIGLLIIRQIGTNTKKYVLKLLFSIMTILSFFVTYCRFMKRIIPFDFIIYIKKIFDIVTIPFWISFMLAIIFIICMLIPDKE